MRSAYGVQIWTTRPIGDCPVSELTRRSLLQLSAGLVAGATTAPLTPAAATASSGWKAIVHRDVRPKAKPQRLFIQNQRTGEVFNDFVRQGAFVFDEAYTELDHLMRDWRRDEVISMDRGLIDLLLAVQQEFGHEEPITVISGYRSQSTNDMLRRRMGKVAKNSYHIRGRAVDFRIKGVSTGALRQVAIHQNAGGVGYYPGSRFIHLDTGPIRHWRG